MPRKTHVFQSNDYTEANVKMRNQVYFKALGLSSNVTLNTKLYPQRAIGKKAKNTCVGGTMIGIVLLLCTEKKEMNDQQIYELPCVGVWSFNLGNVRNVSDAWSD